MSQSEVRANPGEPVSSKVSGALSGRRSAVERLLICAAVVYAALLLLGPLLAMAWNAFASGAGEFFRQVTSPSAISALKVTLLIAASSTAINTVFGLSVAWLLVRDKHFIGRRIVNSLVDLPFAVSPVIAGFMLILLFGRNGWLAPIVDALGIKVVFALPGMLLATVFVSLPFVVREVVPVWIQVGTEQEHAAYTMGASPLQTFWHVTLPAIRLGLLYGVSLSFARAVGEIGAVLVVSGNVSGLTETATLFVYRSLDDRNYVGAYAMAVVLAAISFAILALMEWLNKRPEIKR
jgi:sulfate/thiosulfate transport system permease protein